MMRTCLIMILALLMVSCQENARKTNRQVQSSISECRSPEKISFDATDGLRVTANLYPGDPSFPTIVLCHQAGANKVEYFQIARTLQKQGYNIMAIDQRAGNNLLDFINETRQTALSAGFSTTFIDAEKDIQGAIDYASDLYDSPIILWGSSYSSSLVLSLANKNDKVVAALAFSPNQYQELEGYSVADSIRGLSKPTFVTAAKKEITDNVLTLINEIKQENLTLFRPKGDGAHGASALWKTSPDHEEYWKAVVDFLSGLNS